MGLEEFPIQRDWLRKLVTLYKDFVVRLKELQEGCSTWSDEDREGIRKALKDDGIMFVSFFITSDHWATELGEVKERTLVVGAGTPKAEAFLSSVLLPNPETYELLATSLIKSALVHFGPNFERSMMRLIIGMCQSVDHHREVGESIVHQFAEAQKEQILASMSGKEPKN